ncbi:MAG: hypothetical protein J5702_02420 [Bacteroidales bacterium]|nr:hypothetical protein [Bacteroidales bacterium]
MHKLKELYSSPSSELLVVRFEENFCDFGSAGGAGGPDPYAPGDGDDLD